MDRLAPARRTASWASTSARAWLGCNKARTSWFGRQPEKSSRSSPKLIRRILVIIGLGNICGVVGEGCVAIGQGGLVINLDSRGVAIDKADVVDRILIRDILVAGQALVPGVAPVDGPFGHEPGAGGVLDIGQRNIQQVVLRIA